MGFRQNGFMTVWSVEPGRFDNAMSVRLSSARKNKNTDKYEQDFSGFCTFLGKAAEMASRLSERDRIKLLACDVNTTYNKETKKEYVNYKVFDFEMADGSKPVTDDKKNANTASAKRTAFAEEGDVDEGDVPEDDLPF